MWNLRLALRRRRRREADYADEIASHMALEAERLVADGVPEDRAGYEARRRFGNVGAARERFHEARASLLETTWQDVRYSLRALTRAPVFTTVAVLSLALGIGANTAVFTFINAVLFKQLPIVDPERLVGVSNEGLFSTMDYPAVAAFRSHPELFDGVAAVYMLDRANIAIDRQPSDPAFVRVHLVTGDYFALLGVRAALGRTITMDDERTAGAHPVVVISHAYWRTRFAGSADVLGHTLTLNGTAFTVVGVAPARFTGDMMGAPADLWIPVMMQSEVMPEQPNFVTSARSWLRMLARVKPGVTLGQAAELSKAIYKQILGDPSRGDAAWSAADLATAQLTLEPAGRGFAPARRETAEPMVVVWAIVGLVLAIACVNVAALLLVRAVSRERELTTRLALGATSRRIARLLLTEGALIGAAASLFGVLIALAGITPLQRLAASGLTPLELSLAPDYRVLALTIGTSLAAMLICGVVPARRAARFSLASGLTVPRASGMRGSGRRSSLGRALVMAQVALALVLVVAAGLFTRTLTELEHQDTGFDRDRVLEASTAPEQANIGGERLATLFESVEERIGALPGVQGAAVSSRGLLAGLGRGAVLTKVPGYTRPADEQPYVAYNYVTPTFFRAAGMTLLAGRAFDRGDADGRPRVAVISESMARHYYGTRDAIGKRFGIARDEGAPIEIVGIVRNAKDVSLRDGNVDMMYLPYRQQPQRLRQMCVIVRTNGDPAALVASVRQALRDLAPALPIVAVETMRSQMRRTVAMEWVTALASVFFGAVALLLAALGMFAMVSHAVVRRTSEIGIRMALGGTRASVVRLILRENLVLVGAGVAWGIVLATFATRAVSDRLFGVTAADIGTFVTAVSIMTVAALIAALLPARKATRIDPSVSLRHE